MGSGDETTLSTKMESKNDGRPAGLPNIPLAEQKTAGLQLSSTVVSEAERPPLEPASSMTMTTGDSEETVTNSPVENAQSSQVDSVVDGSEATPTPVILSKPAQPQTHAHRPETNDSYFSLPPSRNHLAYTQSSHLHSRSPANSTNTSSSSLKALDENASLDTTADAVDRLNLARDASVRSARSTHTVVSPKQTSPHSKSSSESHIISPNAAKISNEFPTYPNQSYSVLQSQIYPPSYQPPFLRTRSSHPSQHSLYTDFAMLSRSSRDRQSPTQGSRTAGNTPASSPGLFSPRSSRSTPPAGLPDEEFVTSPYLHPTHLQAPKE